MKIRFFIVIFLLTLSVNAQQRKPIKGRVVAASIPIPKRGVVNLNSRVETKTDTLGNFTIEVAVSDTLVVETTNPYTGRIIIREEDFNRLLIVDLGTYELEEVVINKYENLNPEAMGIVPEGQKQYTPAEKKLYTAGEVKSVFDVLGILAGSKSFDAVINTITGKTKRLKKEVVTEGKETAFEMVYGLYTEEEMETKLGIPKDYAGGFVFYAIEDKTLVEALREKNEQKAKFILSNLAIKYREILLEEGEK